MKPFNEHNPQTIKNISTGDYFLHGDVIVTAEEKAPKDFAKFEKIKDDCLAYGELTGHAHKIFGDDFEVRENPETKERWLKVVKPVMLKHQEHTGVGIPPGFYKIGIQREYSPFEKHIRQVQD